MKNLVLLSLIFFTACALFEGEDAIKPAELIDFKPTAEITRLWTQNIKAGQSKGYTRLTPVIDGNTLYTAGHQGYVAAINRLTGKVQWSVNLETMIAGGVGLNVSSKQLLFGTDNGEVLAISSEDGSELWRTSLTSEILSPPMGDGKIVATQTLDGKLTILDADTGQVLWFYESSTPKLTLRGRPAPIITPSAVYAGFSNGRLLSFNPQDGLILWEQRIAMPKGRSDLDKMVDIHASPILHDGILYVNGFQGRLMAIGRGAGRPIWGIDSSSYQEISSKGGMVFVSADNSKVSAHDANSGEILWSNDELLRRRVTGAQVVGEYVAVADEEGYLHVLDRADGEFAARTRIDGSGVRAALLSRENTLYAYANDGTLSAYKVTESIATK